MYTVAVLALDDVIAFDKDFPRFDDPPGFDVEHARGVQNDGVRRIGLRCRPGRNQSISQQK